jgi:hypothetical protein
MKMWWSWPVCFEEMKERTGTDTEQADARYKTRYIGGKDKWQEIQSKIELFQAGWGWKKTHGAGFQFISAPNIPETGP